MVTELLIVQRNNQTSPETTTIKLQQYRLLRSNAVSQSLDNRTSFTFYSSPGRSMGLAASPTFDWPLRSSGTRTASIEATSGENRTAGVLPVNQRAIGERLCDATPNITTREVEFSLRQMIYIFSPILYELLVGDPVNVAKVLTLQQHFKIINIDLIKRRIK